MATTAEGESSYSYWNFILSFGIAFIDQWFIDTAMEVTATDMAMAVDTTARGPLMPSPDMVTTAEGTDTDMATDMATATDTATATTDEMFRSSCCSIRESSAKMNLDLIGY